MSPVAGVIAFTVLVQWISFLSEASFEGTVLRVLIFLSIGLAAGLLKAAERYEAQAIGNPGTNP